MKTEKHLKGSTQLDADIDVSQYYLSVNTQLVHMFLTLPQYADAPSSISKILGLSDNAMSKIMRLLTQLKIITYKNHKIVVERMNMHLPKESPLTKTYQTLTRLKALERIQMDRDAEPYNYSLFFSADEEARAKVQSLFFEFLKKVEQVIQPAKCKSVYQLQFDLLDWSTNS